MRAIAAVLREGGQLSTGELYTVIGLQRPATIRRLNTLRDAGVIEWVGKSARDPRAFWRLALT